MSFLSSLRVKGNIVEVFPSHQEIIALRIEFIGDYVDSIKEIDPIKGKSLRTVHRAAIFPGTHYVAPRGRLLQTIEDIKGELKERIEAFEYRGMLLCGKR